MSDHFRAADHAMGLELQLEELVEQRTRAAIQGRDGDVSAISGEIGELQSELATTAEAAADFDGDQPGPVIHGAVQLEVDGEAT